MLLGRNEIARQIERRRRPWWIVWYGKYTGQFWAVAVWASAPHGMLCAATPDALDAAIDTFELIHPKPLHRRAHAVGH
jgi:hypothetical protein